MVIGFCYLLVFSLFTPMILFANYSSVPTKDQQKDALLSTNNVKARDRPPFYYHWVEEEQFNREIPTVQRILITYSPCPCYILPREKLTTSPLHDKQENTGVSRILCFYLSLFGSTGGRGFHCETSILLFHDTAWIPKTKHFFFSLEQGSPNSVLHGIHEELIWALPSRYLVQTLTEKCLKKDLTAEWERRGHTSVH